MELHEGILYRMAFGPTADLVEARRWDMQRGQHRNNPAAGGDVEVILAEVVRQLRIEDPREKELVREAVGDAIGGRRPRWRVRRAVAGPRGSPGDSEEGSDSGETETIPFSGRLGRAAEQIAAVRGDLLERW